MTKPTKVPKALRPPKTRPPLLLPSSTSANPGRPRTAPLPGTEDPVVEDVRDAALKYFHLHDQKVALVKKETAAKDELIEVMHKNKLKRYFDTEAQILVELEAAEKVRVTMGKEDEE